MATTVSPLAGASGGCITSLPKRFRVDNFDQTPTKLCTLVWDQVTDAHLQELVLFSNVECHLSNERDRVSLHDWTTDALEAHRSVTGPTFVPDAGTKQDDLLATAVTWTDYTFDLDTPTWWKIEVLTEAKT